MGYWRYFRIIGVIVMALAGLTVVEVPNTSAAELLFKTKPAKPGEETVIQLVIQPGSNLAGLKLTMSYDYSALEYIRADRTADTSAMMHVVNNRDPGKLIVVLAGAVGLQGERVGLLNLIFKVRDEIKSSRKIPFTVLGVEAKSEDLKNLSILERPDELDIVLDGATSKSDSIPNSFDVILSCWASGRHV